MRSLRITTACLLALALAAAGCAGVRASTTSLGGTRETDAPRARAATPSPLASAALPAVSTPVAATAAEQDAEKGAEEAEVVAATSKDGKPTAGDKTPLAGFQVKPYAPGQRWTRSFDLEFDVKVGPGLSIDMRMVSHQEARFEVLAANAGSLDKLQIEYAVYTSKLTVMGGTQDSPEEIAGKRYVITFPQGKPDVKSASGGTPPKKELDTVKDDAREPLEMVKALKELGQLGAKGKGDFTQAGAVSLAGGEDEDTKVTGAKASLRQVLTSQHGERSALLDLRYTLINKVDESSTIEAQLSGSLLVLDAPARYQTLTLQGPLELRSSDPDGMQGRGTTKMTVTYKY